MTAGGNEKRRRVYNPRIVGGKGLLPVRCPPTQRDKESTCFSLPGASSLLIDESLRNRSPRRSDSYPKAQITLMAVQKMQVVVQKMQVEIKTKLVTFVTDNVLLVGIVGNKNLLARMLQDKER